MAMRKRARNQHWWPRGAAQTRQFVTASLLLLSRCAAQCRDRLILLIYESVIVRQWLVVFSSPPHCIAPSGLPRCHFRRTVLLSSSLLHMVPPSLSPSLPLSSLSLFVSSSRDIALKGALVAGSPARFLQKRTTMSDVSCGRRS